MFSSESIEQLNKNGATDDAWKEQNSVSGTVDLFFEDNFEGKREFEPLSDSAEYLAILQRRLNKLQNLKALQQLREKRDQCMRELLGDSNHTGLLSDSQLNLETSVESANQTTNDILRFIKPEQPLTAGEIVPIIKHDQLEKATEEEQITEKSDSEVEK